MLCYPLLTVDTDLALWIKRDTFYELFDQDDFYCRDSIEITNSYLQDWFHTDENHEIKFYLPAFQVINGKTQFINGRHRTAVLLNYLDILPLAYVAPSHPTPYSSNQNDAFLSKISKEIIDLSTPIFLPNLEIVQNFNKN